LSPGTTLLLATRSAGKLRELREIVAGSGFNPVSLLDIGIPESPEEEGIESHDTFEANALAKARHFNRLTSMPTVADDSGLCVAALGDAPGVWSKRYSDRKDLSGQALDDANNARLIHELAAHSDRSASYACAAAFVSGAEEHVVIGRTTGHITVEPLGDEGFGYDPYFFSLELGKTFGQATVAEKEAVSHRGRAFRALFESLRDRPVG
jgi:XTP/dITP diphosphohydrolase